MFRVMPRQRIYFECFERCARASVEASAALVEMLESPAGSEPLVSRIEALERQGDTAVSEVRESLAKNLATPFERSDLRALIEALDDIVDAIDTVAHKLVLYRVQTSRPHARELARLLSKLAPVVEAAVVAMRAGKNDEEVLVHCREVHRLESEADRALRRGIGALFDEVKDPIELIKWKEILEILESATDKCEDSVRIVEEVIRKQG
jgi:predicted phosphate transport protein (TIGR00153 family)